MQVTNYLLDNSYDLVLHLPAIAVIILAIGLDIFLTEPANDGKKKTGSKSDEDVKNPAKGKGKRDPGCVHPSGWCQCNSCACENTRPIPRMLSSISEDRCCGCGVKQPTEACLLCRCEFHRSCYKSMRGDYRPS